MQQFSNKLKMNDNIMLPETTEVIDKCNISCTDNNLVVDISNEQINRFKNTVDDDTILTHDSLQKPEYSSLIDELENSHDTSVTIEKIPVNNFDPSQISRTDTLNRLRPFHFNKFPGQLHLIVKSINSASKKRIKDDFIRLIIEANKTIYESTEYNVIKTIRSDFYVKIPISSMKNKLKIKIFILASKVSKKIAVSEFILDEKTITGIHNRLGETTRTFKKYDQNLFLFHSLFGDNVPAAASCTLYCAYISKDELFTIQAPEPYSLLTLSKWIVNRRYAYDLLFSGYINVKGDLADKTRFLWKQRYAKWYGYTIYLFNGKTKKPVSTINITDAQIGITNINKGTVRFTLKTHKVDIHTDSKENIKNITSVLMILFPNAFSCHSTEKTVKY